MHWRCPLTVLFTSIPFWALAAVVPAAVVPLEPRASEYVDSDSNSAEAVVPTTPLHPEPVHSYLGLSCHANDESFRFSLQVSGSWDSSFCGNSDLLVNGYRLEQDWWQGDPDWTASGVLSIEAQTAQSSSNHSLVLESKSKCGPAATGSLSHLTTFSVIQIDGFPTEGSCDFTVFYHRQTGQRIMTSSIRPDSWSTKSKDTSAESDLVHHDNVPAATGLQDEVKKLRTLEADLGELTALVEKQRKLVDGFASDNHSPAFSDCDDVKCYIRTFTHKAKGCLHLSFLRYGPSRQVEAFANDHDCVWPDGRAARMQVLMSGKPLCLNAQPSPAAANHLKLGQDSFSTSSSSSATSSDPPSDYSTFTIALNDRLKREHRIHTVLGTVLSALCLSCFCVFLHRRCCDPRRQAERAARREERARRREYRRLTRCKAWRDWWNLRVMRNSHGASTDYEEKRGLILSQEAILERAMQDEIRALRSAHTGVSNMAAAAEEGRAYPNDEESLPPYRSRAGSGRPPSYHEYMTVQSHTSGSPEDTAERLDTTPDSSVANLSPRHSSETLRTERSVI